MADYSDKDALEGYIFTPLSQKLLQTISAGLRPQSQERAWSVTGPYGAGKSAASLCISQVLGYPCNREARNLLRQNRALYKTILADHPGLRHGGFVIVPMVGSRQPLLWTLLAALIHTLESFSPHDLEIELHTQRAGALYDAARRGEPLSPDDVAQLVVESARLMRAATSDVLGMILVIDELGRSLEHAVLNPESGDIGILQSLAEIASRSEDPVIGLIPILHQAFDNYAATLSPTQQREWNKVQGRFADIGFVASAGEMLTLVSQAIRPIQHDEALESIIRAEAARAVELDLLPRGINRQAGLLTLTQCAPLHPTVSLALNTLVRSRLAQNERSLFAFLSSAEPYGFQEYLRRELWSNNGYRPFYRLDDLYDYVRAALGSGLYSQSQGKHWAEIEDALARLSPDASVLDARLIKTIGILDILGDQRALRASAPVLIYALADGDITP